MATLVVLLFVSLFSPSSGLAAQPPLHGTASDLGLQLHVSPSQSLPLQDPTAFEAGEVIVRLAPGDNIRSSGGSLVSNIPALTELLSCFDLRSSSPVLPGVFKLRVSGHSTLDVEAAAKALEASGAVAYAEPNYHVHATIAPDDAQYVAGQQWGITQIKAEQAWDVTTGATNIVIAVLDTGTATNHPDLADKIVQGYDFVNNDNDPYDDVFHGTQTAGVAAASSNNGEGIVGTSWGARIMPVKVLGRQGGSDETVARGIRWAVDNGARIINASLGSPTNGRVLREAVEYARDRGVLFVAAAGNTPDGKSQYPAAYESVLSVGATGRSDTVTGFSSWGPFVDVSAPGVGILSTSWNDGQLTYEYNNGTSYSSPFVAGVAALVMSVNPSLTADQVKQIIEDSSDDLGTPGFDEFYGRGRVNAQRAVQMAQQGPPVPRTPTPIGQATSTPVPAATPPGSQGGPSLQLEAREVSPGSLMALTGAGFGINELVDLNLVTSANTTRGIGSAQTGAQGAFRAEVALPGDTPTGNATLVATGVTSGLRASVVFNVTARAVSRQSTVKGVVRGASPASVVVRLKPSIGVSGPELSAVPDSGGNYSFPNLASGIYSLSAAPNGGRPAGPFTVQVDGSAADVKTVDIVIPGPRPAAFDKVASVANTPTLFFFAPVGHILKGPFLKFWQANGGLAVFGYPLSEEFQEVSPTDGKTYTVQYFERNRFEYHPEFVGTRNEVLMGLLGVEMTRGRTFPAGTPFQGDANRAYFSETKHSLTGPFLKYWKEHGGLPIFGYPISEELMENGYLVQYFERNRFEYHPEFGGTSNEVLLGLLGVEITRRNGWIPAP